MSGPRRPAAARHDSRSGDALLGLQLSDRVAAGGDVIGRLPDGRVVFVEGALPGETVDATVTEARRDYARAGVDAVRTASPDRRPAPCPHRRRGCGGCAWQEIEPGAQLRLKEGIVADSLRRGAGLPGVRPTSTALATTGYRTTLRMAVDASGRPSFRRRRDPAPLAVDSCLVAHPWITAALASLRLPGQSSVVVRVGSSGGERIVAVRRRPRPGTVVPDGFVLVGPGDAGHVHELIGGRRWRISANAFFQPGPAAAAALVEAVDVAVGDRLGPGGLLVDAYAGVGLLGGVVAARRGARLLAVESDPAAAADAAHNLADLGAGVVHAEVGAWKPRPAAVVVADPARPGLGRPGVDTLLGCRPARLVLVSCDPASLGRDAGLLAARGYGLVSTALIDSFSQTPHVEVVSAFEPTAGPGL